MIVSITDLFVEGNGVLCPSQDGFTYLYQISQFLDGRENLRSRENTHLSQTKELPQTMISWKWIQGSKIAFRSLYHGDHVMIFWIHAFLIIWILFHQSLLIFFSNISNIAERSLYPRDKLQLIKFSSIFHSLTLN